MKSEHRHELKTNELAEWLAELPDWTKRNYRIIILVAAAIAVVGGSAVWLIYNEKVVAARTELRVTELITQLDQSKTQILQGHARNIDISYRLLDLGRNLQGISRSAKDRQVAALALIKRGEALRMELHYRLGGARQEEKETQINDAKASYVEAIEQASGNPSLASMAKLGLGLCEEELGNFEDAEQIYKDISSNSEFAGTAAAIQANLRLETMDDYREEVILAAGPQVPMPTEMDFMRPQIELDVPDLNLEEGLGEDVLEEMTDLINLPEVSPETLPSE